MISTAIARLPAQTRHRGSTSVDVNTQTGYKFIDGGPRMRHSTSRLSWWPIRKHAFGDARPETPEHFGPPGDAAGLNGTGSWGVWKIFAR
jgi:hypothetical protein